MNALITTIIAGAVVAVIGAFAAYYFGGQREIQKQVYEARREEQRGLNRQRVEAFDEIRTRVSSGTQAIIDWCKIVMRVPIASPSENDVESFRAPEKVWRPYFERVQAVTEKADELENELEHLRSYYQANEEYLKPSTRSRLDAFEDQIIDIALGCAMDWNRVMGDDAPVWNAELLRTLDQFEEARKAKRTSFFGFLHGSINNEGLDGSLREFAETVDTVVEEMTPTLQELQEGAQIYRTAFQNERAQYNE